MTKEELGNLALEQINNIDAKLANFDMGMDFDDLDEEFTANRQSLVGAGGINRMSLFSKVKLEMD